MLTGRKQKKMILGILLRLAAVAVALTLLLSACGGKGPEQYIPEAPIEVSFGTDPATPHPAGEPLTLYVIVTQEGEPVEDAEEAVFEVWQEDEEGEAAHEHDAHGEEHGDETDGDHEAHQHHDHAHHDMEGYETDNPMYEGTHVGEGRYEYEITFDEPGIYQVMYHVTARGYHDMVKYDLEITE